MPVLLSTFTIHLYNSLKPRYIFSIVYALGASAVCSLICLLAWTHSVSSFIRLAITHNELHGRYLPGSAKAVQDDGRRKAKSFNAYTSIISRGKTKNLTILQGYIFIPASSYQSLRPS